MKVKFLLNFQLGRLLFEIIQEMAASPTNASKYVVEIEILKLINARNQRTVIFEFKTIFF